MKSPKCRRLSSLLSPRRPPLYQVLSLELGNALGADRRVLAPATTSAGTIYASIVGKGAPGMTLTVCCRSSTVCMNS